MANTAATQATIGNGQTLNADAARYWDALVVRIKAETGFTIVATEGSRLYARQKYLYDGYRAGRIDPATGRRFNPAWSPDSPNAFHLSGRAVDVGSGVGYVTTQASRAFYSLAGQYGFRPTVAGEPWHFEWRRDWVGISLETASTHKAVIPAPDPEEDDPMKSLFIITTNASTTPGVTDTWLVNAATFEYVHIVNETQRVFWAKKGAEVISGTQPSSVLSGFTAVDKSGGVR